MANQERPHRERESDRSRTGERRPRRGPVEDQNIGDGTDSGGSGYREQEFPGMGRGETRPGHPGGHDRGNDQDR